MNLVSWLQRLMTNFGAGWVMWLLIVLSVVSVAIMLERAWFYWSLRDNLAKLAHDLRDRLRANDLDGAKKRMESSPSAEAAVVCAGLLEADRGTKAAEEAMHGAASAAAHQARAASGVSRHARQQRSVHRPVRHRHRRGASLRGAQPAEPEPPQTLPAPWRRKR